MWKFTKTILLRKLVVIDTKLNINKYNVNINAARNMSQKTAFITGGGGYIASHTIVELLNQNYSVIAVDNMANCYAQSGDMPESLKRVQTMTGKKIVFHNMDVTDKDALQKLFKEAKIDCVLHFAALKAVGESVKFPLKYYRNNVAGSIALTQVMDENNVRNLVFSSSATVYGNPQFQPITEAHPTGNCTNPYGKTKFFCEEIFKDLCAASPEWKIICLRYFNAVSAHESGLIGEDPSGIPNNVMPYIAQVAVGKRDKLQVFGSDYPTRDGTGVRDYVHTTDVAIAHVKALEKIFSSSFKGWTAYNLATGTPCSVLELIEAFSNASGKPITYELVAKRGGDIAECYADASLAKKELGWVATRGLKQICENAWNWQSKNPNGYKTDNK